MRGRVVSCKREKKQLTCFTCLPRFLPPPSFIEVSCCSISHWRSKCGGRRDNMRPVNFAHPHYSLHSSAGSPLPQCWRIPALLCLTCPSTSKCQQLGDRHPSLSLGIVLIVWMGRLQPDLCSADILHRSYH